MSVADVINQIGISQRNRWYFWKPKSEDCPIQKRSIEMSSANTHCTPATKAMQRKLFKPKKYYPVEMKEYLVKASSEKFCCGASLTREDTGGDYCEFFRVIDIYKINK